MPHVTIGNAPYVDGGVREVAPLGRAIDEGADEIVCIACQPQDLDGASFNAGNLLEFALRLMEVVTNELINNDLDRVEKVNRWVSAYKEVPGRLQDRLSTSGISLDASAITDKLLAGLPLNDWREIDMTVIRPENEIVLDLMDFTPDDIAEVIEQGRNVAKKVLNR